MSLPMLVGKADSPEDIRAASQADPAKLHPDARYAFEERLGILAGAGTPTVSQVALAWREAVDVHRTATAASPIR